MRDIRKVCAELQIQAMLFDMDIDWETLSLVPKTDQTAPEWLTQWKEKLAASDRPNTMGLVDYE